MKIEAGKLLYLVGAVILAVRLKATAIPVLILPYIFFIAVGVTRLMPQNSGTYVIPDSNKLRLILFYMM